MHVPRAHPERERYRNVLLVGGAHFDISTVADVVNAEPFVVALRRRRGSGVCGQYGSADCMRGDGQAQQNGSNKY
jgi:hypothetical protein